MLIFLISVPWNLFVIVAIIVKKLYSQPVILPLLNLAITSLVLSVIVMPLNIVSGIAGEFIFGESDAVRCGVCRLGIALIILPWVSIHTLSLMSIDRFLYIQKPMRYSAIMTPCRMLAILVALWVICIALGLPPMFGYSEVIFSFEVAMCAPFVVRENSRSSYIYLLFLIIEVTIPIVVLFVMYIWTVIIVKRSQRRVKEMKSALLVRSASQKRPKGRHSKRQLSMVNVVGAVFIANGVTWFPAIIVGFAAVAVGLEKMYPFLFAIVYLTFLAQTMVQPILEACLLRGIRDIITKALRNCLKKLGVCKAVEEDDTATRIIEASPDDSDE